ncbi:putative glycoside hydrolase family 71 protein [Lasiodiplodia theobromae]|uniref:Glycoside hydrolase family 71 protein n=1 Tax=Lasiodiplodia theobromae TaxID=45133 RepID=A0A8H7IR98_9PEZI|nr:putative glycoside hydrolase family 71 protein [Lasiodiplodia theobromae]
MSPQPDFVQILTWNVGPESHYIGSIWANQNNNTKQLKNATSTRAPHADIQRLLSIFIAGYATETAV